MSLPAATSPDQRVPLASVRRMFEGVIPAVMCTAAADGTPHICYLSQAEYIDDEHVALSFQFFNRSRANVLATGRVSLTVDDPYTASGIRLRLQYLRTETDGPLFERMKAKLAGIASHAGMDKVYRLLGSDVYRVLDVRRVEGRRELTAPAPRCELRSAARLLIDRISACTDLAMLLDETMAGLREHLLIDHAMLLLVDRASQRLYTMASVGYEASGLGAEMAIGQGVAGIAAREGVPIRIGHLTLWQVYSRSMRSRTEALGLGEVAGDEIPLPGLAAPRSQLAVPLKLMGRVIGVLLAESQLDQHFSHDDEDALAMVATPLALALSLLQPVEQDLPASMGAGGPAAPPAHSDAGHPPVTVRRYARQESVFIGDDYLIKGVAGAILWRLLQRYVQEGRVAFSNRELRLDASLKLPDVTDNLEARLILLQRRLAERDAPVQIRKTGRGRFEIEVARPLLLVEA